ncbi:MAG TPA: NAD-dependent epimerase/dehydratase family protein, partial [Patescibacteria group bacterium]|nr:NAD-dependent epimerase/dehydratase family protein [Patescibacteria group bacterium]
MKLDYKIVCFLSIFLCFFFSFFVDGKTVLVTGGAGFIGGTVTENLLKRGDTVVVIDCFISMGHDRIATYNQMKRERLSLLQEQYKNQLYIYECSIENMSECEQIFQRHSIDVMCHLAAHAGVRSSIQNPQKFIKTNIEGTVNVLELAVKYGVKHCVLASSSSVYGNCDTIPFSEEQSTDKQTSVYGATKKSLELIAQVYNSLYGISTTCLRFFTVYGPYGRFDMSPFIFMDAIYNQKPITVFGDGTVVRDFTYIDDIVDGVIQALDAPLGFQIFNLGSTHTIVLNDFITLI